MSNFNPQFQRIGDILVHNDVISQNDLTRALNDQKTSNEKIGAILIKLGCINEDELIDAYSQQMGKKPIDIEEILKANLEVTALLSEDFAKEKNIVALNKSENSIIVVMSDPEDISTLDAVKKLTNLNPEIFISGSNNIKKALDIHGKIKKSGEVESAISSISIVKGDDETGEEVNLEKEEVSAEDAPFVKLVNLILLEAIKEGSTDIHIEPGRDEVKVRIRIDGVLVQIMSPPASSLNGIVARIKILSKLNIAEHRLPQDGRMKLKTSERDIDVRVSILPTVHGEKIVLRLLGSGNKTLTLQNLGFPDKKLKIFRKWINQPYGMVIIS